jgi:O-antigen/teichoic acid export membrane protein
MFTKSNVLFWGGTGIWAVMDQGIFAISNFLLNLLLARWLSPQEYGAFAVGFTIFLLLGNIHAGLLIEPMLVFGKGKYRNCQKEYLASLQYGHWLFSVLGSILFLASGIAVWYGGMELLAISLCGFALGGPFILFLWLMRRFCYVELKPQLAARVGSLYFVLMVIGISVLHLQAVLSAFSALCVIGIASLGSALWLARSLKIADRSPHLSKLGFSVLGNHRRYGGWAAGTNVMMWVPGNIYFLFLPGFAGLEGAAALKASLNLIMPIQQSYAALGTILIPILVTARWKPGYRNLLHSNLLLLGGSAVLYWCLLFWSTRPLMSWLYNGMYDSYTELLWLLALVPILASAVTVFGSSLRALEQPERIFSAYVISSTFSMSLGLSMTAWWGIFGAVLSIVLSYTITALSLWIFHARLKDCAFLQKPQEILEAAG